LKGGLSMNRRKISTQVFFCFLMMMFLLVIGCSSGEDDNSGGRTLKSIAVTPASPIIASGATQQFTATETYSDNTTKDITSSVTWSSSDAGIATITNAGLATAIAAGSTTITATSGSVSGSTTLTISDVGAVLQKTGPFGALMVGKGGEMLLPIVDRDASGNATKITGALYVNNVTGNSVAVYLGADGKPEKTVVGDYILLFANWSADGKTVDIAKIYTPTNYIEVFKGVSVNANIAAKNANREVSSALAMTCLPNCGSDTKTLSELLKVSGLLIGAGSCAYFSTVSLGAAALPCFGTLVSHASFVMGDEAWLGLQALDHGFMAMDGFECFGDPVSCLSFILGAGAEILDAYSGELNDNGASIQIARDAFSNPGQPSGVVQPGGGLPSVPSGEYECTPGGAMHYEPCIPDGVRTCQGSYTWGPCMCGDNFDHLCASPCTHQYSDWSACQSDNTQTRTVVSSSPDGCTGTPVLSQSCTYIPQTCTYTYSSWSSCSDNTQTRTVVSSSPEGCTGTPVLTQSCTSGSTPGAGNYAGTCTVNINSITCCSDPQHCATVPGSSSTTPINQTVASGTSLSQFTSDVCADVRPALSAAGCASSSCSVTASTSTSASFSLSCTVPSVEGCTTATVTETCSLSQ
jgi:hypothetical protein